MKPFVNSCGCRNCTRHLAENIELHKKQGKLCVVLLFRRKLVFVFCLLILEKPIYSNRFSSFRTGCIRIYRFTAEGQLRLFVDGLAVVIDYAHFTFISKKYLEYFLYLCNFNWASRDLCFSRFVFQLLESAT